VYRVEIVLGPGQLLHHLLLGSETLVLDISCLPPDASHIVYETHGCNKLTTCSELMFTHLHRPCLIILHAVLAQSYAFIAHADSNSFALSLLDYRYESEVFALILLTPPAQRISGLSRRFDGVLDHGLSALLIGDAQQLSSARQQS
jgi:hypothetical protein